MSPSPLPGVRDATDAPERRPTRINLLDLPVDRMTQAATLAWIAAAVDHRRTALRQGADAPSARQIVTLNPEIVMASRRDPQLQAAIRGADLVVADGVGIVLAARLQRSPLPMRITGVDLLGAVTSGACRRDLRIFLLGAAPGVAALAAQRISASNRGGPFIDSLSGSPAAADAESVLATIRAAEPDILFVSFGSPTQELWIAQHLLQLPAAVAIGVGGALDVAAGVTPRAPRWMRRAGLEWLFRLTRQPWRWRRMMALPRFALLVFTRVIASRLNRLPPRREKST